MGMDRRKFLRDASQFSLGLRASTGAWPSTGYALTANQEINSGWTTKAVLSKELEGPWLIAKDPANVGRIEKWFLKPVAEAKTARVPGILQESFPDYHGLVWYWTDFTTDRSHTYGRYLLVFNAIDYAADVWLNDIPIGRHVGSECPFELDVTDSIKVDSPNRLSVRVLNPVKEGIDGIALEETPRAHRAIHITPGSGLNTGGIWQPVVLVLTGEVRIVDVRARPDWQTGEIDVRVKVRNTLSNQVPIRCSVSVSSARDGQVSLSTISQEMPSGDTEFELKIMVEAHQLWSLENPFLYRVTVRVESTPKGNIDEMSVPCGFRDFRVVNGYFRLNGKRLFLRSTHTGNHCPYSQVVPPPGGPDMLRLDLLYAKSVGFNTVRFLAGMPLPYQLDLCDEIGLLVYEESVVAWVLQDSSKMQEQFESAVEGMILRDRNHPCVVMWGMLNETNDGPVFRKAVSMLPIVRSLDPTRMVMLSSGRWDAHLGIGSFSNPGSSTWECEWAKETPGAGLSTSVRINGFPNADRVFAYDDEMGDIHFYPDDPQTDQVNGLLRTMGKDSKPIFISETGIGSMMDVIHEAKYYEQQRVPEDAADYQLIKSMADRLTADWERWAMSTVYPFPENLLYASQVAMARHRLLVFNLIRSNPKFCGYNLTGMLDHGFTGEGLWHFWRDFKPGALDAVKDGWAPVRWCLFVNPTHTYLGRPVKLEAVLANEDVLSPGKYNGRFRVWGPNGLAWDRASSFDVQKMSSGEDGPLAIPVLAEEVVIKGPAGPYALTPNIDRGAAPPNTSWEFHLSDPASLPTLNQSLTFWGVPSSVQSWLREHGASGKPFSGEASANRELILVGDLSSSNARSADWRELASRMERGGSVLFLSPLAFQRGEESTGWLPLARKGRVYKFYDWLYHKECVAKSHPIFEGLQSNAMLDWYYYGQMIPHYLFELQDTPHEVVAAAFATGYPIEGGYASGILVGKYSFGAGEFLINTFPIIEHLGNHPVADRLLINMIRFAAVNTSGSLASLPPQFDLKLREIGYEQ